MVKTYNNSVERDHWQATLEFKGTRLELILRRDAKRRPAWVHTMS